MTHTQAHQRKRLDSAHFNVLRNALHHITPCELQKTREEGETVYYILDGCGDRMGDGWHDLEELELYIRNNDDVDAYLQAVQ